jgi:hypothetical protein
VEWKYIISVDVSTPPQSPFLNIIFSSKEIGHESILWVFWDEHVISTRKCGRENQKSGDISLKSTKNRREERERERERR